MIVNIVVSLNSFNELDISHRKITIDGTGQVKIMWWLVGNLAQAAFLPIGTAYPGFEWVNPPSPGNFRDPEIDAFGRSLSIIDYLKDHGQEWEYILRVFHNGKFYESVFKVSRGGEICATSTSTFKTVESNRENRTEKHPVIINR